MRRIEVIIKAIQKAIDGGWEQLKEDEWYVHDSGLKGRYVLCIPRHTSGTKTHLDIAAVIFDREFCKALWPASGRSWTTIGEKSGGYEWEARMQAMVVDMDPIKYLEQHI